MQPRRSKSYAYFDEFYPAFKHKRKHLHSSEAGDLAEHIITPQEAELISEQLGPRVRELTDNYSQKNEVTEKLFPGSANTHTILTLGCGGVSCDAQKAVAALSDKIIGKAKYNVKLFIHSGDFAYPEGAKSATDPIFHTTFYHPYAKRKYHYLRPTPFRVVLGNHEFNDRSVSYWREKFPPFKVQTGKPRGKHVIRHAHMYQIEDPIIPVSKKTLLSHKQLDISEAPKFGMEYYFGSDIDGNVQYIYLNSSTLLNEFLDYKYHIEGITKLSPEQLRTNQFVFLLKTYNECITVGRIPILVMHHPLINMGSRNIAYDSHFHHTPLEMKILDRLFQLPVNTSSDLVTRILIANEKDIDTIPGVPLPTVDAENLCLLLARLFASHNMVFRAVICAHEHMMSVIRTNGIPNVSQNYHPQDKTKTPILSPYPRPDDLSRYPVFQIISGGGGGPLQDPYSWNLGENIGCCIKANGVCAMTYDPSNPKVFTVDLYTVDGMHLQFNDQSARPIIAKAPKDEEFEKGAILRELVNKACFKYQEFLEKEMKKSNGTFLDPLIKSAVKTVIKTCASFFKGDLEIKKSGNLTHKMHDVIVMNQMQAYVNSNKPIKFTEAIETLYALSLKLKNKDSADSFMRDINEQLFEKFDKELEELHLSIQNKMQPKM